MNEWIWVGLAAVVIFVIVAMIVYNRKKTNQEPFLVVSTSSSGPAFLATGDATPNTLSAICKQINNSSLADSLDLENVMKDNPQWCTTGWMLQSPNSNVIMNAYPVSKVTNTCGPEKGINLEDGPSSAGVTCYGTKPTLPTATYPYTSPGGTAMQLIVQPFNVETNQWSEYSS